MPTDTARPIASSTVSASCTASDRCSSAHRSAAGRSYPRLRGLALPAALLSCLLLLPACAREEAAAPAPNPTASSAPAPRSAPPIDPLEADAQHLRTVLQERISGGSITADQVRQAIEAAGWTGEAVEVGQDVTPTGLDVDSVDAGVKTGEGCLLADVRPEGQVSVATGQPLADGRCFAGHGRG